MPPKQRAQATPMGLKRALSRVSLQRANDEEEGFASSSSAPTSAQQQSVTVDATPEDEEIDDIDDDDDDLEHIPDGQDAYSDDDDFDADADGDEWDATPPTRSTTLAEQTESDQQVNHDVHAIPAYPQEPGITRTYTGPLKKWDYGNTLIDNMYGPDEESIDRIMWLRDLWINRPILPGHGGVENEGMIESPWLAEDDAAKLREGMIKWWAVYKIAVPKEKRQSTSLMLIHDVPYEDIFPGGGGDLSVEMGPRNYLTCHIFKPGDSMTMDWSGLPMGSPITAEWEAANGRAPIPPSGWTTYLGGIPLSTEWAPLEGRVPQVLAVATIPARDQDKDVKQDERAMKRGCLQFWNYTFYEEDGRVFPSRERPFLQSAFLFDWGRPRRIKWCPVPIRDRAYCGLIAVLTTDHKVRVLEVKQPERLAIEMVHHPLATLSIENEYNVRVTTFTWVNTNRICLGHSDGSISLWSIHPTMMLSRIPICSNNIVDIASGFPSNPYIITVTPIGGSIRIVDLQRPSQEHSYASVPTTAVQPGLSCWSDHMQGFIIQHPSTSPGNTTLTFGHISHFPLPRTIMTGPAIPICADMGAKHPFLLAGFADGSVYTCNALRKMIYSRGERLYKLEAVRHEYIPQDPNQSFWTEINRNTPSDEGRAIRGAARVWMGFYPEINKSQANDIVHDRDDNTPQSSAGTPQSSNNSKKSSQDSNKSSKSAKSKGKAKVGGQSVKARKHHQGVGDEEDPVDVDEAEAGIDAEEDEDRNGPEYAPYKFRTNESLTRVTAVAWNPNIEFGWWTALAFGSGLLKVMDIGIHHDHTQAEAERAAREAAAGDGADDMDEDDEEDGGEDETEDPEDPSSTG